MSSNAVLVLSKMLHTIDMKETYTSKCTCFIDKHQGKTLRRFNMNIMDIVLPGINLWFLLVLLLLAFIVGMVVSFRMLAAHSVYRGDYR